MKRSAGVLLHVSSLPDGGFGKSAFEFIDFLAECGIKYWQVLPLGPTDCFGSPYSSESVFAGNTKFITASAVWEPQEIKNFITENKYWIEDYANYMVKKYGGKKNEYIEQQMLFFSQWGEIKKYANDKGIQIIGDVPFYPARDSADVWAKPGIFDLNGSAGVPPDYFNEAGQNWGNPLYDFKKMARDKYKWWVERLKHTQKMYDVLRIDHFRAFDSYYDFNAKAWNKGPGLKFFRTIQEAIPRIKIILEDLGDINKSVLALRDATGYPGMRVMQFGFDGNSGNEHLPHNYPKNCVAYIGTHDNDTFVGFLAAASPDLRKNIDTYLSSYGLNFRDTTRVAFENILSSRADVVVLSMQDLLFQDNEYRMNLPGSTDNNWKYRMKSSDLTPKVKDYLKMIIERAGR